MSRQAKDNAQELRQSPTMNRLLESLEKQQDVGHYGRLVFAMVARHFLDHHRLVELLASQPGQDEEHARALVAQVQQHGYNPPSRERLLEWQSQQDFQICDPDDPDSGNLYRELRFPDGIYDHIEQYWQHKAEALEE